MASGDRGQPADAGPGRSCNGNDRYSDGGRPFGGGNGPGNGRLLITDYAFETASGRKVRVPRAGDGITLILDYEGSTQAPLENVDIGFAAKTAEGSKLVRFSTESLGCAMAKIPPRGRFKLFIPNFPFAEESYLCGFRVVVGGEVADSIPDAIKIEVGRGDFFGAGHVDDHSPVYVAHDWSVETEAMKLPEKIAVEARR